MENLYGTILLFLLFLIILRQSRNYLLSFFFFAASAVILLNGYSVADGFSHFFSDYLYRQVQDPTKAAITVFIAFYCGYVGTMEYGGSIKGFTRFFAERSHGQTGTQLMAWLSSVGAFFSDLGSPGIVGTLFRKKYDEQHIPREKLALLINLTAVPVCSMIPLVGWGLFAIGILYSAVTVLGLENEVLPIALFLRSIPYFCFSFLAILTPLLVTGHRFCIGELRKDERELAADRQKYLSRREKYCVDIELAREEGSGWPLITSLIVMLGTLFFFLKHGDMTLLNADTESFMICLGIAFVLAALTAIVVMRILDGKHFMKTVSLYTSMFKRVVSVTGILIMSWIFFQTAWEMGLYQAVNGWILRWIPGVLILPLLFLAACLFSSRTGSAWGTYAVIIPLAFLLWGAGENGIELYAAIGAAVSGSVYGDISSKISHAMHYSAESAGVDPHRFAMVQKPYMRLMAASCFITYGAGYYLPGAAAHLLLCVASYLVLIVATHSLEMQKSAECGSADSR